MSKTRNTQNSQYDYTDALKVLRSGGIVLHKTDTLWGLACDATHTSAVSKLKSISQLPDGQGYIVLISAIGQLSQYVDRVPDIAWDLVEFAEKPLTVVYPKGKNVDAQVLASDGSLAIRLVKDSFCQGLVHRFGRAIVSTQAISKSTSQKLTDIPAELLAQVDFVFNESNAEGSTDTPSTILKLGLGGEVVFLRK
jgi:L-threonylcarbamoyladenylate synthase